MQQIVITKESAGKRLDKVLSELLDGISRSRLQRFLEQGSVFCNGKPVVKKKAVAEGDVITLLETVVPVSAAELPLPQNIPLDILYEDEVMLVVNKPAGMVVHPGHGVPDGTLVNALMYRETDLADGFSRERPGIVHRLDKDTSGVLLVAKTAAAHTSLAEAFACRNVHKQYFAVCIGRPSTPEGCIEHSLDRHRREPIKRAVSPRGKPARTSYRLCLHRNGISLVEFFPHTGRTHQIRVHCSASNFPVLADSLYGGSKERILRVTPAERPFAYRIFKCFSRHALHARKITFPHPQTNNPMTIEAPLPEDFKNALWLFGDDARFLM